MFVLSAMAYPVVLALACVGAGLAVDRLSAGVLPGVLLPVVGVAALIAVSQLTTYIPGLAPATPEALGVVAAGGLAAGWPRIRVVARGWREHRWQLAVPVIAFVAALAPVLFAGRPTFSAYMVLTDSALHIAGADYLIRHGQHYAHLNLLRSYGQYIHNYYAMSYPTGADALLGGTAFLVHVPVIWAFQPFNAFILATASGPAWLLARRSGLCGASAAAVTLAATLPALVYAYELIGSIKEITALPLILAMGALVVEHRRWLLWSPRAALPFALLVAGGVSALGLAFGAWTFVAVSVLIGVVVADGRPTRQSTVRLLMAFASGMLVLLILTWPTWHHVSGSVSVAQAVATSANRGNLVGPLRAWQVFGTWLTGSYLLPPHGAALAISGVLIGVTALAGLAGSLHLVRSRRYALAGWLALMVLLGVSLTRVGAAWSDAKTLMLSSPVFIILAGAGLSWLRAASRRYAALALSIAIGGGVLASDVVQYHDSNLAPTARYDELARINSRFAGRGPTLFTDFDEYALYELRDMDIGGLDFMYRAVGLAGVTTGHGAKVELNNIHAASLRAFPLIVTRRNPAAIRPPFAYRLLWQGTYYQVWGRSPGASAAIARYRLTGTRPVACSRAHAIARVAAAHGAMLVAARPADVVYVDLQTAHRSANWKYVAIGVVMAARGQLRTTVRIPTAGTWNVWLQGEIMPTIEVQVDGHAVGHVGGAVGGDLVVPDTAAPLPVRLHAGRHTLTISRGGLTLAPGDGGSSLLIHAFLTPAGAGEQQKVDEIAVTQWRSMCGQRYVWIEAVPRSR